MCMLDGWRCGALDVCWRAGAVVQEVNLGLLVQYVVGLLVLWCDLDFCCSRCMRDCWCSMDLGLVGHPVLLVL